MTLLDEMQTIKTLKRKDSSMNPSTITKLLIKKGATVCTNARDRVSLRGCFRKSKVFKLAFVHGKIALYRSNESAAKASLYDNPEKLFKKLYRLNLVSNFVI